TWDGTNGSGNPAPNGVYHVKVDSIDNTGVVLSTTQQAIVSRTLYQSTILIYNEAGEIIRHLYDLMNDPGPAGVSAVQLSTLVIQPTDNNAGTNMPTQVTITLSNGTTVSWDGKSDGGSFVQSGQYFIEVHTKDGQGAETIVTKQVSVQDVNVTLGIGTVIAQPNTVDPTSLSTVVTFKSNSALTLTLRVSLYTTAGEFVQQVEGPVGQNQAAWDTANVASGLYLAVVEVRYAAGGLANRQILKVVIIH
ncbi:MAG TPA: hypothetical protein VIJ93_02070, partial [bacterium]